MGERDDRLPAQQEGLVEISDLLGSGRLGTRSKWALRAATEAAKAEGIEGILVIKIPSKIKDYAEVTFTIGAVDVVNRWMGA